MGDDTEGRVVVVVACVTATSKGVSPWSLTKSTLAPRSNKSAVCSTLYDRTHSCKGVVHAWMVREGAVAVMTLPSTVSEGGGIW